MPRAPISLQGLTAFASQDSNSNLQTNVSCCWEFSYVKVNSQIRVLGDAVIKVQVH